MSLKTKTITLFQKYAVKPRLVPLYTHLYKLSLRGMGVLNSEGNQSTGEKWLWQKVAKSSLNPTTIIDVGANIGGYTGDMMTYFPESHYYCIEPNPQTYKLLQANLKTKPNTHLYQKAVSDTSNQTVTLFDFADHAPLKPTQPTATMASLYQDVIKDFHHQPAKKYRVKTISLDDFIQTQKLKTIDWLKIDVEGHELSVLKGAKKGIRSQKINLIQFEFNDMHAYSRTFFKDIVEALRGYTLYRLLPQGWYPLPAYRPLTHEIFGFQNLVALSPLWQQTLQ